jgi:hypothetical protein
MILGGNVQAGNVIVISAYEIGGGNQLYKNIYNGADVGNNITVPVAYYTATGADQIQEFVIFVNGVITTDYTYAADGVRNTTVTFNTTYTITDSITVYVLAPTVVNDTTVDYSWSMPQTQLIAGVTSVLTYTLDNNLEYVNPDSLIVTVNGVRARTAAGIRHVGDGSTAYTLPDRLGFSQSIIVDNEVHVYVDDEPQTLYVDFVLEPYDGTPREVIFITEPPVGSEILIYVTTNTQCYVNGDQLVFNLGNGLVPVTGDVIAVTTWNDTRQQQILSQRFVGPVTTGVTEVEPYDSTDFDTGTITGAPGSYDYSSGITVTANDLDLGVVITNPDRLWVSLNGRRLFNNAGFTVSGTKVILTSGILNAADEVMITQFTNFVVPESMAFRIFQDMRGVQATYRITPETTTTTTSAVTINADVIYVTNAGALAEPNFDINVWGVATIDAERIMYRYRDTQNNTISGLMRGTAGTAVTAHAVEATVYNMGRDNLLPEDYQDYIVSTRTHGDGSTTVFTADNINLAPEDSTLRLDALEVYVGGIKQSEHFIGDGSTIEFALSGIVALTDSIITVNGAVQTDIIDYSITETTLTFVTAPEAESIVQVSGYTLVASNPAEIVFETAPAAGSEVTMLVRRGVTWYAQGTGTASNGEPLQITETAAARFLRGL